MKINKILIFLLTLSLFASFKLKANVDINTNDFYVSGAQVRTSGNAGIRFVGDVSNIINDCKNISRYGILIAYGETNDKENFILNGNINEKIVLNNEVSYITNDYKYYVTLYNIPQEEYNKKVSARAYLILNDSTVLYSDIIITRSLKSVCDMAYADNNNSEFVLNVYNYFRISEINLSIDFSEHYIEKEEVKFTYTYSNPLYDTVTIIIDLKTDFSLTNNFDLIINNKIIDANDYQIENNKLTCIIDDPYWTDIY